MSTHTLRFRAQGKTEKTRSVAGLEVATWSLETQPFRSQRILKPSNPPLGVFQFKMSMKNPILTGSRVVSHSVFGSPVTQVPENPKAEHPTPKVASFILTQF